jgi:CheY-like chemotaxis protein
METIVVNPEEQALIKNKTILLVEDNENDSIMTQRALRKANILNKVVWVKDGVEALDHLFIKCLEEGEALPQLILLDIHMPRVNGIEVLQRIREDQRLQWLPVVIFTSSNEERDLIDSYNFGVNSYTCKPIAFEDFARIVSHLGCYWLLVNKIATGVQPR